MSFLTQQEILGRIPAQAIIEALDDDRDGEPDEAAWTEVLSAVRDEIEGRLGPRYSAPFAAPVVPVVKAAAKTLAIYFLHERRGLYGEQNPLWQEVLETRRRLDRIASGDMPLTAGAEAAADQVTAITGPSKTHAGNRLAT